MPDLIQLITAAEPGLRNQPLEVACAGLTTDDLLKQCARLDGFRRRQDRVVQHVDEDAGVHELVRVQDAVRVPERRLQPLHFLLASTGCWKPAVRMFGDGRKLR